MKDEYIFQNEPIRLSYTFIKIFFAVIRLVGGGDNAKSLDRGLKAFRVKDVNNIVTLIPNRGNQTNKQTDKR